MKRILYTCFCIIIIFSTVICTSCAKQNKADEKVYSPMLATWAHYYGSIGELVDSSDIIALVEIESVISTTQNEDDLFFTVYEATVLNSILGNQESIEILMTGAETETFITEIRDDPLMSVGEKYLIFAFLNVEGTYTILGGPCGRFIYNEESDSVTSLLLEVYDDAQMLASEKMAANGRKSGIIQEDYDTTKLVDINDYSLDDLKEQIDSEILN